ncbi:MAG: fibronectin type III domain-containing protein, partial [Bacteroidales bacterium]|nr:fibronectin type III domain-containing protein [Bacteroidales bacterium]
MKKINLLFIALLGAVMSAFAQTAPAIGTPDNDTLFVNSGQNFLLIPHVNDNDQGVDQEIFFTVTSSNENVLEVQDVEYTAGNTFAVVHVIEKGNPGSVTISVDATDPDGTANTSFDVYVGPYSNPGINFEIHDLVFWQRETPLDANPAFSMITESGVAPYDEIDLPSLQLSVYSDCKETPPCTGTDFFTAFFRGYIIAPATGDYSFYMVAGDQCNIGLSTDEDFDHNEVILFSPSGGRIGTPSGDNEWKSVKKTLTAGKTYAIYGTHWNIHTLIGGMMWEGPGIEKEYIPGAHLSYVYDVKKPTVVEDLTLEGTGLDDLRISWSPSSDDRGMAGYNVYVNGTLSNGKLVDEPAYQITGLMPDTRYCVMVIAVDMAGNESAESGILCTRTYASDVEAPLPPSGVNAPV